MKKANTDVAVADKLHEAEENRENLILERICLDALNSTDSARTTISTVVTRPT